MPFTVEQAAVFYRVPIIDYERPGAGLLVASGTGIMLAVMDGCPALRWCVDADTLPAGARLGDFLLLAELVVDRIAVAGWFTVSDPEPLRASLRQLKRLTPVTYGGNLRLGVGQECQDLTGFLRAVATEPTTAS